MAVQLRQGGAWQTITGGKVYASGAWRTLVAIKVYVSGAWRDVANFTPPSTGGGGGGTLSLSLSDTSVSKFGTTASLTTKNITVTPSGGLAPYTYTWSVVTSDGFTYTINAPSAATTSVTASTLALGDTRDLTIHCVVRDSLGVSATSGNVAIHFERTGA